MPPATTGRTELEIQLTDGTWLPLSVAPPMGQDGNPVDGAQKGLAELMAASDNELPISKRLIPVVMESFSRGVGLDYHEAPGLYTRTDGYALPAGKATRLTLPASGNSFTRICAMAESGTTLFLAQTGSGSANTGRIITMANGTGTPTNSYQAGANIYIRDFITFQDATGASKFYASYSNAPDPDPGTSGGLVRWDGGTTWVTSASLGAPGLTESMQRMAKVFWEIDGVGAFRLVAVTGSKTIAYTLPNSDPMLTASWVLDVPIGTGANLLLLPSARRRVWATAGDNTYDLDEQGNTPALTSYTNRLIHGANGLSAQVLDDYLYTSLGSGMERIYIGDPGMLQQNPGQCAPGWGTPAENTWRGFVTAMGLDQHHLLAAIHNPSTLTSGIFWGRPKEALGIESPNPLIWYGPEVIVNGGYKVSYLYSMAIANDDLRLFVAMELGGANPEVAWVSIPMSGSPLQDLLSGGKHRYTDGVGIALTGAQMQYTSHLHLLPESVGDRVSRKIVHQHGLTTRGLGAGTKLIFEDRADPSPGSTSFSSATDVILSPQQDIEPENVTSGYQIERRIKFVAPNGGAAIGPQIPVLDAIRSTFWRHAPSFMVLTGQVEYGDGVLDLTNTSDENRDVDPDTITERLIALTETGRVTLRENRDRLIRAKVLQTLDLDVKLTEGTWGKRVTATIEIVKIRSVA